MRRRWRETITQGSSAWDTRAEMKAGRTPHATAHLQFANLGHPSHRHGVDVGIGIAPARRTLLAETQAAAST
jgi:hypothetical protein